MLYRLPAPSPLTKTRCRQWVDAVDKVRFWGGFLLRLERKKRGLLMLPFALAACGLLFWRIPVRPELEPYLDALSIVSAASIIAFGILMVRREYRSDDEA